MGYYNIDFPTLVKWLLPVALRQAVHRAWLEVVIAPVIWLHIAFTSFRANNLYDLAHNGQVCKLEAVLNDAFDGEGRRIYISDFLYGSYFTIYLDAERKDKYLFTDDESTSEYLWLDDEIVEGGTFIVNVPTDLVFDLVRMESLLVKYKLVGKQYIIQYFSV